MWGDDKCRHLIECRKKKTRNLGEGVRAGVCMNQVFLPGCRRAIVLNRMSVIGEGIRGHQHTISQRRVMESRGREGRKYKASQSFKEERPKVEPGFSKPEY